MDWKSPVVRTAVMVLIVLVVAVVFYKLGGVDSTTKLAVLEAKVSKSDLMLCEKKNQELINMIGQVARADSTARKIFESFGITFR